MDGPIPRVLSVVNRCGPDESALRGLVCRLLRKDKHLLEDVAAGDMVEAEGSAETLRAYAGGGGVWPAHDRGWVTEAASLSRYGYWFAGQKPDRVYESERSRDGLPSERATRRAAAACFLSGDLSLNSELAPDKEPPPGGACLTLVDAAWRLGGEWPEPCVAWLAAVLVRIGEADPEYDGDNPFCWMRMLDVLAPMAMLAAACKATGRGAYPLDDLFDACRLLDDAVLRSGYAADGSAKRIWLARAMSMVWDVAFPLLVVEALLPAAIGRLEGDERAATEAFLERLRADKDAVRELTGHRLLG